MVESPKDIVKDESLNDSPHSGKLKDASPTDKQKSAPPKEKPKVAQKPKPKKAEDAGDGSGEPLLKEKETAVVQPGKTGLKDSGQGDSQA